MVETDAYRFLSWALHGFRGHLVQAGLAAELPYQSTVLSFIYPQLAYFLLKT